MRERQADFALLLPSDPLSHVHVIVQPQHLRRSGGNKKKDFVVCSCTENGRISEVGIHEQTDTQDSSDSRIRKRNLVTFLAVTNFHMHILLFSHVFLSSSIRWMLD